MKDDDSTNLGRLLFHKTAAPLSWEMAFGGRHIKDDGVI